MLLLFLFSLVIYMSLVLLLLMLDKKLVKVKEHVRVK